MQPRFSVITPVLNGLKHVPSYVECLKRQTYTNWEAIVIDDGSTDGTNELLQELTAGDSRFRYTYNTLPRQVPGPYQARNVGLELVRGEFICFLDIDDYWLPNKLIIQTAQLKRKPHLRLLYSTYLRSNRQLTYGKIRHSPPILGPKSWIHLANPVPMLTACVDRDIINGLRFEPFHHEDFLFWHAVLLSLQDEQLEEYQYPLAIYNVHSASTSCNKLKATGWIWHCYRRIGYSRSRASVALVGRAMLQAWLIGRRLISRPINLKPIIGHLE
jgi:teichuronic acid biosynthesis glycosyltransferase TuaG